MAILERVSHDDREKLLGVWRAAGLIAAGDGPNGATAGGAGETIVIDAPLQPINLLEMLTPAAANAAEPVPLDGQTDGVRIFAAAATPERRAVQTVAGLPMPSIIVGNLAPTNASFDPAENNGSLTGNDLGGIDLAARQQDA